MSTRTRNGVYWVLLLCLAAFSSVQGYMFMQARDAQKQAEEARNVEACRVRTLLYASPDPMIMCNETRKITAVNAAAGLLFGWVPDELVGKPIDIVVADGKYHEAHNAAFTNDVQTLLAKPAESLVIRTNITGLAVKRNGEKILVNVSLTGLRLNGHVKFVASIRPVTPTNEVTPWQAGNYDQKKVEAAIPPASNTSVKQERH